VKDLLFSLGSLGNARLDERGDTGSGGGEGEDDVRETDRGRDR
jgi:hypothetical protein